LRSLLLCNGARCPPCCVTGARWSSLLGYSPGLRTSCWVIPGVEDLLLGLTPLRVSPAGFNTVEVSPAGLFPGCEEKEEKTHLINTAYGALKWLKLLKVVKSRFIPGKMRNYVKTRDVPG